MIGINKLLRGSTLAEKPGGGATERQSPSPPGMRGVLRLVMLAPHHHLASVTA